MAIQERFESVFEKIWEVNFLQCAPNGKLNYTNLCNLLQLTAAEHSELGGMSFTEMQKFDQAWVLSKIRIEIKELPEWRDLISIKTWIVSLENSRSVRALEVFKNGQKIISCETFWVVLNTKIRRPENLCLPHEHCEKFPENLSTVDRVKRIRIPEDGLKVGDHKVVFSDLDVVNHVNNVKYLEWCLDFVDSKILLNHPFKSLEMNFLNELLLKDQVELYATIIDKTTYFSVVKDSKNCFALEFNT